MTIFSLDHLIVFSLVILLILSSFARLKPRSRAILEVLVASSACSSGSSNTQTPFEELFRLQGTYSRVRLQIPRRSAFARGAEQDSVYIHADTQGQQHLHSLTPVLQPSTG